MDSDKHTSPPTFSIKNILIIALIFSMNNITNIYLFNAWSKVLFKLYPSHIKELFYILSKEHTVLLFLKEFLIDDLVYYIYNIYHNDSYCNNKTVNRLLTRIAKNECPKTLLTFEE
jgi:hypothetical protein